jgi:glycyl-tRNA synthetase
MNSRSVSRNWKVLHSRTDFDLSSHAQLSGKKIQYFDPELNEHYTPYVVETSVGCDRMVLSVMSNALVEELFPMHRAKTAPARSCAYTQRSRP